MNYINTSDEKYLSITHDFTIRNIEGLSEVKNNSNFVGIVKIKRNLIFIQEGGDNRLHEWAGDIKFLNVDGTPLKCFKLNGWEFSIAELCLSNRSGSKYKQCFRAKFIDLKHFENISEIYDISEDGVSKVINKLVRLSKFEECRIASLYIENEDLVNENQILKDKISKLHSQIDVLKDILND